LRDIPESVEVVVIGGGPAGAAVALSLARAGRGVLIVERERRPRLRAGETLPPSARLPLGRVGLWDEFEREGHVPSVGNRSAWGGPTLADYDFIFSPYGSGWHIDRRKFDGMLLRGAKSAGALLLAGARLAGAQHTPGRGWLLDIGDGARRASVKARFVVDATGRASGFAVGCGVERVTLDHMVGIVGYFETGEGSEMADRSTLVEAVESGWWYSALLPEGRIVAAYMTDADLAARDRARTTANWHALLAQATHTRRRIEAYGYRLSGAPRVVAANSSRLRHIAGASWLAAGDAAAAYDPLSSLGIVTALSTGLDAAAAIDLQLKGDSDALRDYARRMSESFASYVLNRTAYYRIEKRWPDSPFWSRRQRLANASAAGKAEG
jgi:flavin-dependent dehydrogenase